MGQYLVHGFWNATTFALLISVMPLKEQELSAQGAKPLYELVKDHHLLAPVVMIGPSALIPIPFMDDMASGAGPYL